MRTKKYRPKTNSHTSGQCFYAFFSWSQLTIKVELKVAPLIEKGDIYLSTNFNDWNAGEPEFEMAKIGPTSYSITLENSPRVSNINLRKAHGLQPKVCKSSN